MKRSAKQSFAAMGSSCNVDVLGDRVSTMTSYAIARVRELEHLWSRFLDDSDISRINHSPGVKVQVSPLTIELLELSLSAWETTAGVFCPFGERLMVFHGYDQSFDRLTSAAITSAASPKVCVRGRAPIHIDTYANKVSIDDGFGIDLGGIAKGFTADLVSDELMACGAKAAMVDIGGDIACRNAPDHDEIWRVEVEDPRTPHRVLAWMNVRHGGVATSSTQRRQWMRGDHTAAHHVMDHHQQASASSGVIGITIAADRCADAEVLTKVALCGGLATCVDIVNTFVPDVVAVTDDGGQFLRGGWVLA